MFKYVEDRLKSHVKRILTRSKALRALNFFSQQKLVILRYHSVLENSEDIDTIIGPGLVHTAKDFEEQMKMLSKYFNVITMDDVLNFTKGSKLPRYCVAVTFDDGFVDNALVAAPIMEKYGVRGAFYVTTGSVAPEPLPWFFSIRRAFYLTKMSEWVSPVNGTIFDLLNFSQRKMALNKACEHCAVIDIKDKFNFIKTVEDELNIPSVSNSYMMTSVDIKKLCDKGHIIGSHTVSHSNIAHIGKDRIRLEMEESKKFLENIVGEEIVHFSYPAPILSPHYDQQTIKISKELGYKTGVTCTYGSVYSVDNSLCCRRVSVPNKADDLRWVIETSLAMPSY